MINKKLKIIMIICWILLLICLIPMFMYSQYTYPSADDYTYSRDAKIEYDDSGSLLKAIVAGTGSSKRAYENWQGTYFGTFLMSISPNIISVNLYQIAPILLMLIFILSTLIFLRLLIKYLFKSDVFYAYLITPIISFLSIMFIPSLVEGIYWYNGSWYYTFSHCLTLLLFSTIITGYYSVKSFKKYTFFGLSIILIIMLGGVNFTSSFFMILSILTLTAYQFYTKSSKKYLFLSFSIVGLICILISYLAPGNATRSSILNADIDFITAIFYSFSGLFQFTFKYIIVSLLGVFVLILKPIIGELLANSSFSFKKPWLLSGLSICIVAAMLFPPIFTMETFGPWRLTNVVFYMIIYLILYQFVIWYGYFLKNVNIKKNKSRIMRKKKSKITLLNVLTVFLLFISLVYVDYNHLSFVVTTQNISNGSAQQYKDENLLRFEKLNDESIKKIVFTEFTIKPYGLFFDDIVEDERNWKNSAMSDFYYKESIKLIVDN